MKKTILTFVIMAFAIVSFAQKPAAGNLATEANFNLSNFNDNFTLPALRFRYFVADDLAVRADLSLSGNTATTNFAENADGSGALGSRELKTSGFGIGLGVEKHFGGNDRFSPFALAQFSFNSNSSTETWADYNGGGYVKDFTGSIEGGSSVIGFNLGLGADYWINNSFYIGTELGLGLNSSTTKEGSTTTNDGTNPEVKFTTPEASSFGFGQSINPAFRIGFLIN